jgi:hypothetical protein
MKGGNIGIILYLGLIFHGIKRLIYRPKKKSLLKCPKSGQLEIDPDGNSPCVECSHKYYGI